MTDLGLVFGDFLLSIALMVSVVMCLGRGRIFAVGIMAFFGIGMLIAGSSLAAGHGFLVGLIAVPIAGIAAVLHGPLLGRLRGDGFVIVNLLLLDAVRRVVTQVQGTQGLTGVPIPGGSPVQDLWGPTVIVVFSLALYGVVSPGEWRRRWSAIADAQWSLVEEGGVSPRKLETLALALGAMASAAAGVGSVWLFHSTEPAKLSVQLSISVFAFSFVGGMSLLGAILAAAFFTFPTIILQELFTGMSGVDAVQWRNILVGIVLVGAVLWSPAGIAANRTLAMRAQRRGEGVPVAGWMT